MINVEAQHLTRLIDNVLCYARINDLASPYELEPVDVVELVQESIGRFQPRTREQGIEVQLQTPPDPATVNGDHLMLLHVFDNLVENAITHAGAGKWLGITVTAGPSQVNVEVADRGDGIPHDDLLRVFEKFYRRKGTRQRGTGLGLAIVRRIVDDHGGRVDMASIVGRGTTVLVSLPLVESHQ
jgi:two-component system phosphate regulon sensor histidine kinase PhoR